MQRIAHLILLSTLLAGALAAENRALLIGIGHYEVAGADLPGVDQDIKMMGEVARKLGFAPSQIKSLSHSEATLEAIRDTIESWLIDGTTPSDRVLFYHSGHGTLVPDENGDEADGHDEALLPYDFTGGLPHEKGSPKPSRVLLDDELGRMLKKIPAHEVVVLVDSCHSGTMTRSITRKPRKFYAYAGMPTGPPSSLIDKRVERYESVILLSAAKPEQEAQTSRGGALFTKGIYQAVLAAESRRDLTVEELRSEAEAYIHQAVGDRVELRHTPALDGNLALKRLNIFLPTLPPPPVQVAMRPVNTKPVKTKPKPVAKPPVSVEPAPVKLVPVKLVPVKPAPVKPAPAKPAPAKPAPIEVTPVTPGPPVTPANAEGELWSRLERVVDKANNNLHVQAGKTSYQVGESLSISVTSPGDGYLHILNLGDGEDEMMLLFPNRYQPENKVRGGEIIHLPGPKSFRLPAHLPAGRQWQRNLVVVIHTVNPINLDGRPLGAGEIFRMLDGNASRSLVRSFRVEAPAPSRTAYSAGQVVVTIAD